ncbi:unnamed protein product [Choristocarpus tenellus]
MPKERLQALALGGGLLRDFLDHGRLLEDHLNKEESVHNRGEGGRGHLHAACLQVVFAVVYRSGGEMHGVTTPDEVMEIACNSIDRGVLEEEVRISGFKLLMGVAAAELNKPPKVSSFPVPPRSSDTPVESFVRNPAISVPAISHLARPVGVSATAVSGSVSESVISPAVLSRAKRLVLGAVNMDPSVEVRKLAVQAASILAGGQI